MDTQNIVVKVVRDGKVIKEVTRPVRFVDCRRVVTYRGQLWPLGRGNRIHVDKLEAPPGDRPRPGSNSRAVVFGKRETPAVRAGTQGKMGHRVEAGRGIGGLPTGAAEGRELRRGAAKAGGVGCSHKAVAGSDREALVVLSPEQAAVVHAPPSARILVEAGPGTGKTEVVAHRLVRLLEQGLRPAQILVLSFSRSAARTLAHRVERMTADTARHAEELRHVSVRTFDSWTFRMLRQLNFSPAVLLARSYDENIGELVRQLRGSRRSAALDLLRNVRHVIVDEFQDLSGVRGGLVLELLTALAPPGCSGVGFTVLGDPAQAIYGFALRNQADGEHAALTSGALVQKLGETYGREVSTRVLEQNYRAEGRLASLVSTLRRLLLRKMPAGRRLQSMIEVVDRLKPLEGELTPGALLRESVRSAAVLTSTNGEAIRVAQRLHEAPGAFGDLPVRLQTGSRPLAVPAWIGATLGPMKGATLTRSQFSRIYSSLYGGSGAEAAIALGVPAEEVAWQRLVAGTGSAGGASALDLRELRRRLRWPDLLPDEDDTHLPGLHVMTIHQSKGMEFDAVAILADRLGQQEHASDAESSEAANVIFVGMTRAAKSLFRLGEGQTRSPLSRWTSGHGRHRWKSWTNGWVNLEMGIPGDVEPLGFIDPRVHDGGPGAVQSVKELQDFLARSAASLRGRKVMLKKWPLPDHRGHYVYRVHLQEGNAPGRVLGLTTQALTLDILDLIGRYGYVLPSAIFNLRVTDVTTVGLQAEAPDWAPEPWKTSGLWVGVNLHGTGDFKVKKRAAD